MLKHEHVRLMRTVIGRDEVSIGKSVQALHGTGPLGLHSDQTKGNALHHLW